MIASAARHASSRLLPSAKAYIFSFSSVPEAVSYTHLLKYSLWTFFFERSRHMVFRNVPIVWPCGMWGLSLIHIYLDRKLSEMRIFPAISLNKSGTRREDLLLDQEELEAVWLMRLSLIHIYSASISALSNNLPFENGVRLWNKAKKRRSSLPYTQ